MKCGIKLNYPGVSCGLINEYPIRKQRRSLWRIRQRKYIDFLFNRFEVVRYVCASLQRGANEWRLYYKYTSCIGSIVYKLFIDVRVAPTGHSLLFHLLVMQNTHTHSLDIVQSTQCLCKRVRCTRVRCPSGRHRRNRSNRSIVFCGSRTRRTEKMEFEQKHNRLVGFDGSRSRVYLEDACKMWMWYCSHMFGSIKILNQPMHSPVHEERTIAHSYLLSAHMHINGNLTRYGENCLPGATKKANRSAYRCHARKWMLNSWINGINLQWILIKIEMKAKWHKCNTTSALCAR